MCRQRHVHQLSRTRFIEMVDARMQLPADWMYWPSNWPRRRTEQ
ncbi:hypothetical protein BVRB_041330 [Beta vulgaris subsp. vulgaris]|uniref:Uncharacterized protein n=1 Tax=Beta vulgaris subsp. vulgaris TaxID=3555 RepID=A0A0J7YMW7_BETVV|nr:hypothetical protein BVRB_041330 [Beta vulgaris subsp. vulgaris]